MDVSMERRRRLRAVSHIDVKAGPGLEVGPLSRPLVLKTEAEVYYVDFTDADWLRRHYAADPNIHVEDIVDLDFVLSEGTSVRPLSEVATVKGPYAWAVASHVIEHVPDLVGFLTDVAELLEDGGKLALVIPDRRYCFDAVRPPTTTGQVLRAHLDGDSRPSVRAVYDHFRNHVSCLPRDLWDGKPPSPDSCTYSRADAWGMAQRAEAGEYIDSHVWLFTPSSFVEQLRELADLALVDFTIAHIEATDRGDIEFFVTLQRLPRALDGDARHVAVQAGFPVVEDRVLPDQLTYSVGTATELLIDTEALRQAHNRAELRRVAQGFAVSSREIQLITLKRRVIGRLRRLRSSRRDYRFADAASKDYAASPELRDPPLSSFERHDGIP